ncbi:hypothetical protein PF003_g6496 [Phytophthora fragariae]|nr:hypothetical protein PF003_g6496 [Phytophthora fragariae]
MLSPPRPNITAMSTTECCVLAIDATDAGMTIREASKRFNVGRESLRMRCAGFIPLKCRPGPQLLYINEDAHAGLLEAIEYRATRGMCIGTSQFRELVRQAAVTSLKPVPDNVPGTKWVQRWVRRHADTISYRKGQILAAKRAECSIEQTVRY